MLRGGVFRGCTVEPVGDHERMRPADTTPPGHGSGERSDAATGCPTTPPLPADAPRRAVTDGPETWPTGRLLVAAGRRVMTAWDEAMTPLGLTHATLPVLVLLARSPHSQRDLAHAVALYLAAGLSDRARELSARFLPAPGVGVHRGGGFLTEQPTLPLIESKPERSDARSGQGTGEPRND